MAPARRTDGRCEVLRVAIVAGEASGDLLAAGLLEALAARCGALQVEGICGPRMQALGYRSLYPMERLSVMGLFEAFGRYPEVLPLRARLAKRFTASRPDVFIGIDAPDFNISLERVLRRAGIPTVHYVSPSVWAWRRYRIPKIRSAVTRMLTLFPFEAAFYRDHEVPVTFVGHPLADEIAPLTPRADCRRELGLEAGNEVVALLPGSRISEVKYLAEPMLRTARWLAARRAGVRFVVPLVDAVTRECFAAAMARCGGDLALTMVTGHSRTVMGAADAVLLASGTAALEALLLKRPMVITYRTTWLTYQIMKRMLHVPHVGLPNLLAGRSLVPELLQDDAVPERLGPALLALLEQPGLRHDLVAEFDRIHAALRLDASRAAAEAVAEVASA